MSALPATWIDEIAARARAEGEVVRVVVASAEGSAPREAGAAMIIGRETCTGSIGGGALELAAVMHARRILTELAFFAPVWRRELVDYPLGPALAQCCGGYVRLLFEVFTGRTCAAVTQARSGGEPGAGIAVRPCAGGRMSLAFDRRWTGVAPAVVELVVREMLSGIRPRVATLIEVADGGAPWLVEPLATPAVPLHLYGAGHVGRAIVHVLDGLPFDVAWVDTSRERFPDSAPRHARMVVAADPAKVASRAPAGALHLVMTYSHALDLAICEAVLRRGDFAYLGLIGSRTKRARFVKRLGEAGVAPAMLARLTCPIGIEAVRGKTPVRIAIATAAQLVAVLDAADAAVGARRVAGSRCNG